MVKFLLLKTNNFKWHKRHKLILRDISCYYWEAKGHERSQIIHSSGCLISQWELCATLELIFLCAPPSPGMKDQPARRNPSQEVPLAPGPVWDCRVFMLAPQRQAWFLKTGPQVSYKVGHDSFIDTAGKWVMQEKNSQMWELQCRSDSQSHYNSSVCQFLLFEIGMTVSPISSCLCADLMGKRTVDT